MFIKGQQCFDSLFEKDFSCLNLAWYLRASNIWNKLLKRLCIYIGLQIIFKYFWSLRNFDKKSKNIVYNIRGRFSNEKSLL